MRGRSGRKENEETERTKGKNNDGRVEGPKRTNSMPAAAPTPIGAMKASHETKLASAVGRA